MSITADSIRQSFVDVFGAQPEIAARAPGRLEILGNHTDYNQGVVLSVAVDRATYVAARKVSGTVCRVVDVALGDERTFDLADLAHPTKGDWANYIKGMVVELGKRGIAIPAFEAVMGSTIPLSAGMSSSAAFEMSFGTMMLALAGADLEWRELAKVGQACENRYVGANTGLLDQFSSLMGKAGQLVFSDFRSLEVRNVPLPAGTALVVANSMVKHNLTNEYNERRESCERAAAVLAKLYPGVVALRDVSFEQLEAAQDKLDPVDYRRALHVVGECTRVMDGVAALERGDVAAFGQSMFVSQDSSTYNFENSCAELDALVAVAKDIPGALGARLSGGGFGGITVHLVQAETAETYAAEVARRYQAKTGLVSEVMICRAGDGAALLQ
jgi:galactokinase